MWKSVFDKMLSRLIVSGSLEIAYPDGETRSYGAPNGKTATLSITDPAALRALCLQPDPAFGEAYMDGDLIVKDDDLDTLMQIIAENRREGAFPPWVMAYNATRFRLRSWLQRNTAASARANVAHHYDISDDLYALFLDGDMQYSCGYFTDPAMSLEDAQTAKKQHIARKLRIEPGMRVLDIGCGWGGMALTLAQDFGAQVTGVTLSENQLGTARARSIKAGLQDQTDFRLLDYRSLEGQFDRIVSVGMLEHVGLPHYDEYFAKLSDLLDSDGIALIHTIGRNCPPHNQSKWINKYIFPGGYVPSLSELSVSIENSGLWNTDVEVWRLHYAMTIRHWRRRFEDNLEIVRKTYDDRFIRMWRYYLTACIHAFEIQQQAVFHFQLAHKRDAVPITRDYLYTAR
ncbi:MAG: cyclopropane-fatty-acyl-phospholipid synthase family protein [Rhodobacteraceae bacterium]|nr:cyclopropane-fatty-acyl-phospholipid synthase family protein [Paracoccaceae bacterium]